VLRLYREQYFDFNEALTEKLAEEHAIELSYSWIKTALQTAAWWRGSANAGGTANSGPDGRCLG
jgi:hypothetical protein